MARPYKRKQPWMSPLILTEKMDFESAMQTFAEAWMAANRSGLVLGENSSNKNNSKVAPINSGADETKAVDEQKVRDIYEY